MNELRFFVAVNLIRPARHKEEENHDIPIDLQLSSLSPLITKGRMEIYARQMQLKNDDDISIVFDNKNFIIPF